MAQREIVVGVRTDETRFNLSGSAKELDRFADRLKNVGQSVASVGDRMTLGITAPLLLLGKASVDAASDTEESLNKVNVVFAESSGEITAWAKNAARSFGLSQQQALEATGTFGNMFTSMGLGVAAAADMSTGVVELASDLASFNNIGTDEALEKIRAGLVGEVEPLRSVGVNLNAAAVQAKALELGLGGANGEVDAAGKAQAAYALIMEQTTNAQGDFTRTSGGLANQQRITKAEFADMRAELGEQLVPIMANAVGIARDLTAGFSELSPAAQSTVVQVALFAAGLGPVLSIGGRVVSTVGSIAGGVGTMSDWFRKGAESGGVLQGAMARMGGPAGMGAAALGIGAVGFAIQALISEQRDLEATTQRITDELDNWSTASEQQRQAMVLNELAQRGMVSYLDTVGLSLETYTASLGDNEAAQDEVNNALAQAKLSLFGVVGGMDMGTNAAFRLRDADATLREAVGANTREQAALGQEVADTGLAMEGGAVVAAELGAAHQEAVPFVEAMKDRIDGLGQSMAAFSDPAGVYTELLQAKQDKERETAEVTAESTTSSEDSWKTFVTDVTVSLAEYATELETQNQNARNWETNLVTVAGRAGSDVAILLSEMGSEGVALTAQMANGTDAEMQRTAAALREGARSGSQGAAQELAIGMAMVEANAKAGGQRTAAGLAHELGVGVAEVRRIADLYGVQLAEALNPVIVGSGGSRIAITGHGRALERAAGGWIHGPGTATSDDVPVMASDGEYVVNAKAAKRNPRILEEINAGVFSAGMGGAWMEGADHDGPGVSRSGFGGVKPWVAAAGHVLGRRYGITDIGGVGSRPNKSDHPTGHALDFMTYRAKAKGDALANELTAKAAHYAVKYLIWQQRMNSGSGWRPMADRGSITANHFDHVHASFLSSPGGGRGFSGAGGFGPPVVMPPVPSFDPFRWAIQEAGRSTAGYARAAAQRKADNPWGMADGGTLRRPGTFVVGENGPELANLTRGDSVIPSGLEAKIDALIAETRLARHALEERIPLDAGSAWRQTARQLGAVAAGTGVLIGVMRAGVPGDADLSSAYLASRR